MNLLLAINPRPPVSNPYSLGRCHNTKVPLVALELEESGIHCWTGYVSVTALDE